MKAKLKRAGIVAAVALVVAAPAAAAPSAELWPYWQAHDEAGEARVDHSAWSAFLEKYVVTDAADGINRVRYGAVTTKDRARLGDYIDNLARTKVTSLPRDEQFAYWANLYNALTVRVVLEHYPVDSIRDIDISPGWFSDGPWDRKLVTVENHELSLNDIEHRILRPIWRDPRVHYALNCASLGCPDLMSRPWRAADLDACLDRQARRYVNDPRGVRLEGGRLEVSKIYQWYRADFGGTERGVLDHLARYADGPLRDRLRDARDIDAYRYDWSLNDAQ